jgi:hypothetical protein
VLKKWDGVHSGWPEAGRTWWPMVCVLRELLRAHVGEWEAGDRPLAYGILYLMGSSFCVWLEINSD